MGRHYREIFTDVVRRIGSWRGRGGGGFRSDRGITGLCAESTRADFFSLIFWQVVFCLKNSQKIGFFTISSVLQAFFAAPDTTEPDRSRAGIDPQCSAERSDSVQSDSVRAAVAHDAVAQDVALAFGVVVFHFRRYYFADIWHFAHRYNFGDVQV